MRHPLRSLAPVLLFLLFLLATMGTTTSVSAQAPFTVQDILSSSIASGLVAAPVGDRIVWIENHEGRRNLWVADGPDWRGRQLTNYDVDDGQELTSLTFSTTGEDLFYVRGGAPNRQGETPDPLYTADEEERAVWRIALGGGDPVHIIDGGSISVSTDGSQVAFTEGRDIMSLALVADAEPERLARIRSGVNSLRWSPDGTKLAFVSNRGDHAFVGVLDLNTEEITYLDPSVGQDGSPAWSPDGKQIAFLRIPNERVQLLFAPHRTAPPFSIRVADVATGKGMEVWKANEGVGSAFSFINAANQLMWGDGDYLVFPWEGDGWKHLYSVPANGGRAELLTPGDFEVQFVALAPDAKSVVYDSGQDDIDRKHVWRVDVTGGSPELLTPGTGLEWAPVVTAAGTVAFHASSTNIPAHTEVLAGGNRQRVGPEVSSRFPMDQLVEPQQVIFSASDGMQIHAQLFLPPDHQPGQTHPAALFFHGGSRRQMLLGFHHSSYYHNAYAFNQLLAASGYVVLAVNYRSGIGYGMEFREAENYGATGASEFADVMGAGLYLQNREDVDPNRIGLWGGSYGGYLTALGLARASDLFKAGVDLHGVHDWNVVINGFVPSYEPEDYPDFSRIAYESSPMAFMDGWRSPVLLIHGDDDRNVPFSETVDVAEALSRRGVEYEQLIFPDEVHGFLLHKNWIAAYEAALDFFERRLKAPIS